MLPSLTVEGVLPPGIHVTPLEEVVQRFGGGGAQRGAVTLRLRRVCELARQTRSLRRLFLWGSYVSDKAQPGDIDLFLVMSADFRSEAWGAPVQAVFDGERAEKELGATVLWTREDAPAALLQMFLDQWQIGRDGTRRGIVEVEL